MRSFANELIKLKLGHYIGGGLVIANHLDESLSWTNQKNWAAICFSAGAQLYCALYRPRPKHFSEPNQHTLDFLHPILLWRITYLAPLEMLFQQQKQTAHYNFNPFRQVVSGGGFVCVCPSIKIRGAHVKVPNSCSFACFNFTLSFASRPHAKDMQHLYIS